MISWSDVYVVIRDWQGTIVALPLAFFAWFQWEISNTISIIEEILGKRCSYVGKIGDLNLYPIIHRLGHLPSWVAPFIYSAAYLRVQGSPVHPEDMATFKKEHAVTRRLRKRPAWDE